MGTEEEVKIGINNYIVSLNEVIKEFEEMKEPVDRLDTANKIGRLLYSLRVSVNEWGKWWTNLSTLNEMTEEDYALIYNTLRTLILEFLRFDLLITQKKTKEWKEKFPPLPPITKKEQQYHYNI